MSGDTLPAVRCTIEMMFPSPEEAERAHRSVAADNDDYVASAIRGSTIVAEVEAQTLMSLLHTLDDYMACVGVAYKIVSGGASPRSRSSP